MSTRRPAARSVDLPTLSPWACAEPGAPSMVLPRSVACGAAPASVPARERGGRSTRCLSGSQGAAGRRESHALASRVSLRVCRVCHFNNQNQDSRYSNRCVSNRRVGRHAALVVGTQRVRFRVRARVVRRAPLGVVVNRSKRPAQTRSTRSWGLASLRREATGRRVGVHLPRAAPVSRSLAIFATAHAAPIAERFCHVRMLLSLPRENAFISCLYLASLRRRWMKPRSSSYMICERRRGRCWRRRWRRRGLRGRGEGSVLRGRARAACVDQSACCDLISSILAGGL